MRTFWINANQHSKILGFALIAYSLQLFFPAFNFLGRIGEYARFYLVNGLKIFSDRTFYNEFSDFAYFFVILLSGIFILVFKDKIRLLALAFVLFFLPTFPLGTILSFYTLYYLFVISENEVQTEDNLLKAT